MHILIVDDEKVIREGFKRTISGAFPDIRISTAATATEANHMLLSERIHSVFLDIMMPGMNGLELLAKVRHTYRGIKWIVVSAHSEFAYAQEALRLGARDYILKPLGKEQIVKYVAELFEEWSQEQHNDTDTSLLMLNLNYLREAVFRRWIQGLDLGRFDLSSIRDEHEHFHLLAVKLESHSEIGLGNFIVENVMSEYIHRSGKGFIVSLDGDFLVGVITLADQVEADLFREGAITNLNRCLRVPFRFIMSEQLTDFYTIPSQIKNFHISSIIVEDEASIDNKNDVAEIAIQYIKSSFQKNLSLELVSSIVYLNPVYFSKLFKQKTGTGYKEYVTKLRMEKAEELLADSELSITKIAETVGYPDVRHFTQVFRKNYACTPSQFRLGKVRA
ncbi:response regulator [Paenibacillus sp. GSMTC-2017]|uniref:response regulator n=1 Tax=Paenibacillus sp. GSMTC-2017 TaxID=2794350 RepID=UPI0018D687ED|nr:response regulator [Paenibacillus sp. GSMTC-2017]MBH5318937.1 response regulator [Paenibacillus sp. GSMTC-2017]